MFWSTLCNETTGLSKVDLWTCLNTFTSGFKTKRPLLGHDLQTFKPLTFIIVYFNFITASRALNSPSKMEMEWRLIRISLLNAHTPLKAYACVSLLEDCICICIYQVYTHLMANTCIHALLKDNTCVSLPKDYTLLKVKIVLWFNYLKAITWVSLLKAYKYATLKAYHYFGMLKL